MRRSLLMACVLLVAAAAATSAQTPRPTFEVASVKKLEQPAPSTPPRTTGTVFARTNITLALLVQFAYNVQAFEVVGGPDWIRQDRFAIEARASREMSFEEMRPLVQSLLEDRFTLVARREQQEMRRSELVLARADGRPGPALKPCSDPNAKVVPPPSRPPSGATVLTGRCQTIAAIARFIVNFVQFPLVDKTGLTGTWDFELTFADPRRPLSTAADAAATEVPALATALREQWGLKLESRPGPVDVIVIESVQQPMEN